jgi:HAD superfamily hydrolase (TIGR01509 family)
VKAVLWDLDGTLADSRDYHWRAWRETMSAAGVAITESQFQASFGQRNDAILSKWLGDQATPDRIRRIGDAKEALYRRFIEVEGIVPLPGAAEWVRRLKDRGWRQAIASSAPRANVEVMARVLGFAESMSALIGAEDVQRGKPEPDVFLSAGAKVETPPDRCVVVEDAAAGIEAARRAGMRSVGVGGEELAAADVTVRSLADLPLDVFDRLIRN